jgi:hypothetical protein
VRKADNLTIIHTVVMKSGNLSFLEPSGPLQACNGTALRFTVFLEIISFKYGRMDPTFQKNLLPPYLGMGQPRGKTHSGWRGQGLRQANGSGDSLQFPRNGRYLSI